MRYHFAVNYTLETTSRLIGAFAFKLHTVCVLCQIDNICGVKNIISRNVRLAFAIVEHV